MTKPLREAFALLGLFAPVLYLMHFWREIPAIVPVHYGLDGQPNRFAGKDSLWGLPAISCVMYLLLLLVTRFPRAFNLPRPVGHPLRPRLEAMAISLLGWMRLEIVWLFGFLAISSAGVTRRGGGLPVWFTPVAMAIILGTVGIFIVRSRKLAAG